MKTPDSLPPEYEILPGHRDPLRDSVLSFARILIPALIGGLIGAVGYAIAASVIEAIWIPTPGPDELTLSYGQQAGLFAWPLCTITLAAVGLCVALAATGRPLIATTLLLAVAAVALAIVGVMWNWQIERYGRQPSDLIVFYPPAAVSLFALATAVVIGMVSLLAWFVLRVRTSRQAPVRS